MLFNFAEHHFNPLLWYVLFSRSYSSVAWFWSTLLVSFARLLSKCMWDRAYKRNLMWKFCQMWWGYTCFCGLNIHYFSLSISWSIQYRCGAAMQLWLEIIYFSLPISWSIYNWYTENRVLYISRFSNPYRILVCTPSDRTESILTIFNQS